MSLKEQWDAARVQRQQEVLERKQEVATFLQEVRSDQQETWLEQRQQRAAYVAAIKNYVWGTTPTSGDGNNIVTESGQSDRHQAKWRLGVPGKQRARIQQRRCFGDSQLVQKQPLYGKWRWRDDRTRRQPKRSHRIAITFESRPQVPCSARLARTARERDLTSPLIAWRQSIIDLSICKFIAGRFMRPRILRRDPADTPAAIPLRAIRAVREA